MKSKRVQFRSATGARVPTVAILGIALAIAAFFALFSPGANGIAAARKPDASSKKVETYYLLVFSNPVAGMEDEYNKWYSQQHQKDVVSVPGFMTAQRFVLSDVQLRESKPLPKYLIMYKIVTDDLPSVYAEVTRRLQTGITVISPSFDKTTSVSLSYRAIRPMIYHKGDPDGAPKSKSDAQVYYQLVFSNPTEGQEDEYNRWYDAQHEPDVVSAPGFVEAQRFVLSDPQLNNKSALTKYLVLYKIASDDVAARFKDFAQLSKTIKMSPAFGENYGYTYKAMEPMIYGDKVRAERASKKPAS
jgi:hypothetical protein